MASLKMPEVNHVMIAGNLTKDPVIRKTPGGIPVINFCLASNHRYRDGGNQWAEEVCYVGVVAWSKLADSCMARLRKGSAVLVDGELQSRTWHSEEVPMQSAHGAARTSRTIVEIKAHRIQFLNKAEYTETGAHDDHDAIEFSEAPLPEKFHEAFEYAAGFEEASAQEMFEAPASMELKLRGK